MRIVVVSETFAKHMGYIQNFLPAALAAEGHDVHLVTTALPPNHTIAEFNEAYGEFLRHHHVPDGEHLDGVQIHYEPFERRLGYTRLPGLRQTLRRLRPDVVQVLHTIGWLPLDAAIAGLTLPFGLFTAAHYTRSVFTLAQREPAWWEPALLRSRATRALPGRLISMRTDRCYAATDDCAEVAIRYFGVQAHKVDILPLGVDTQLFHAPTTDERLHARATVRVRFGIADDELLLIYTGRFTADKRPALLAEATARLRAQGRRVRALFVGGGPQRSLLEPTDGCHVTGFVPNTELPTLFWAADIGVWPAQESLSMLDAAASGLPVIVNNTITARERHEGNGRTYILGDAADLAATIESLTSPDLRRELGQARARKMAENYSWTRMARRRQQDYQRHAP